MQASTASLSDLTCVKVINIFLCHNTAECLVCFIAETGFFLTQIQYCTFTCMFQFYCDNQSRYNVMLLLLAYYVVLLFDVL